MPAHPFQLIVAYYAVYAVVCISLIVTLQIVLHRAGAVFLTESFGSNSGMARAIRTLLDIGYYLVCLGYVTLTFQTQWPLTDAGTLISVLSIKVGIFLLLLGALHVFNLLLLALFRNRKPAAQPAS